MTAARCTAGGVVRISPTLTRHAVAEIHSLQQVQHRAIDRITMHQQHAMSYLLHVNNTMTIIATETGRHSNLTNKTPHRRCTRTVQSYLPGCANVHTHLTRAFLDPSSPYPKRHLDRFSRYCTDHDRESIYPYKLPLPIGGSGSRVIHLSLIHI